MEAIVPGVWRDREPATATLADRVKLKLRGADAE